MEVGKAFYCPVVMSQVFSEPVVLAVDFTNVSQFSLSLKWDQMTGGCWGLVFFSPHIEG